MKNILITIALIFAATAAKAQFTVNFENMIADSGKVLNGSDGSTFFNFNVNNRKFRMPTYYDTAFGGIWSSGWALSRKLDSTTKKSDFMKHLYCAKPKFGDSGSKTFAVGQSHTYIVIKDPSLLTIAGFSVTNTTLAFNSMKLGDAFAKKFGGSTGNDSDFFFLRMKSYYNGQFKDSQDVFLADFRDKNNANDYILKTWKQVLLKTIADSITFDLYSSDNAPWGMNTPGFFAVDNVKFMQTLNVSKQTLVNVNLFPNPSCGQLHIQAQEELKSIEIIDMNGKLCSSFLPDVTVFDICTDKLNNGFYFIKMETEKGIVTKKIQVLNR